MGRRKLSPGILTDEPQGGKYTSIINEDGRTDAYLADRRRQELHVMHVGPARDKRQRDATPVD
jgi:hypothetical protein